MASEDTSPRLHSALEAWLKISTPVQRALGVSEENIALGYKSAEAYSRGDFTEGAKLAEEGNWKGQVDIFKAALTNVANAMGSLLPQASEGTAGKKHMDDGNRTRTRERPTRDRGTY